MKWKCFICDKKETGNLNDFHKHYMEEHDGDSRAISRAGSRQKRVDVREVRDRFEPPLVNPSQEATGHGGDEEQNDSLPGEPPAPLW